MVFAIHSSFVLLIKVFRRFCAHLESKRSSSSTGSSRGLSVAEEGTSDEHASSEQSSNSSSPEKGKTSSDDAVLSTDEMSSDGSSGPSLMILSQLLLISDEYLEEELFNSVTNQILNRPMDKLSDWAVTYSIALAMEKELPAQCAQALNRCDMLILRELVAPTNGRAIMLICDLCQGIEHTGFPVRRARIPICDCDKCLCVRAVFDSSVVAPVRCSCRSKLFQRVCRQRKYGYPDGRPMHSDLLLAAFLDVAELGSVEPLARLSEACEMLLPLSESSFLSALNEAQLLYLLKNCITVSREIRESSATIVAALEAKGFSEALEYVQSVIARK